MAMLLQGEETISYTKESAFGLEKHQDNFPLHYVTHWK